MHRMALRKRARSILGGLLRAASARRTRVFILGVTVTVAFLILPSWNAWNVYRDTEQASGQELRFHHLIGTVVHLDEVLTMSARMAAATGDTHWEERYWRYEPKLRAAIRNVIQLTAGGYAASAERVDAANRTLVSMETRAFEMVRSGRRSEASDLLSSDAYESNKRAFADGVQVVAAAVDQRIQSNVQHSERRVIGAGALALVSAGTLVVAWVGVVALIWRHLAQRQRSERERRYLEAQIQRMQKLESLGVMAGGIAHDFNNLLTPILGHADLALADLPPDSPIAGRLQRLRGAARRLSDLTRQLIAYSGRGAFEMRPLDLSHQVEQMTELLEILISKRADLRLELASGLPATDGDASQLSQVVVNLVANAADALGDEAGTITVRTGIMEADRDYLSGIDTFDDCPVGPYVYLEVVDSGCGIERAARQRIFDPFFTTKFTGRGLGLSVVLGIVRRHRGAIRLDSEPGRGTAFRILLPCSSRAAEVPAQKVDAAEPWRGRGTVLVVDDDPGVRELAEEMLRRLGFAVLSAQEGGEGVEAFRKHAGEIDAVLLDLTMPGISGEETLRRIHSIQPDQPVVLMSGYSEEVAASQRLGGVAGFLHKPFAQEELGETLRQCLEGADGPPEQEPGPAA
jgi:signal transduction histidine kinase/CheY-like chemotaxis protein